MEDEKWDELEELRERVLVLRAALNEARTPLLADANVAHVIKRADEAGRRAGEARRRESEALDMVGAMLDGIMSARPFVQRALEDLEKTGAPSQYSAHIAGTLAELEERGRRFIAERRRAAR